MNTIRCNLNTLFKLATSAEPKQDLELVRESVYKSNDLLPSDNYGFYVWFSHIDDIRSEFHLENILKCLSPDEASKVQSYRILDDRKRSLVR